MEELNYGQYLLMYECHSEHFVQKNIYQLPQYPAIYAQKMYLVFGLHQ